MKPRHLIEATANDGISLALTSNGDLVVTSAKEAIEAWREQLKANKATLIDYLALENRLSQLVTETLKERNVSYDEASIILEILSWPAEDLSDILRDEGFARCAIDCVAMRHQV